MNVDNRDWKPRLNHITAHSITRPPQIYEAFFSWIAARICRPCCSASAAARALRFPAAAPEIRGQLDLEDMDKVLPPWT